MRVIIEKYLELLKDNENEFSLNDFYEIFKTSLRVRELKFCTQQKELSSSHKCYLCAYYESNSIRFYLGNHTLTLFKVLYVLGHFSQRATEKIVFKNILEKIRVDKDKLRLINIYFQVRMIKERHEGKVYMPEKLEKFISNSEKSFDFLDKVSKNTSLEYFFIVGIPTLGWDNFKAKTFELQSKKEFDYQRAYWKRYTNFLSSFVNLGVNEEMKIINRNKENLIWLSKIIFDIIPSERTKITIASDYFFE